MSGQSGGQRLCLSTLNEQLTCKLCGGYFIDATTIIECLHSFCKSCIVKYLENNKYCPVCDAQVHKNKPLLNIRPDQILQDIVYKLVPGCYQNEMRCRKEFFAKHPEEKNNVISPEARGEPLETYIYSPDESLSLSLEYYSPEVENDEVESDKEAASKYLPRRYLRCPAAVTVFHLQKLIRAKYGLSEAHRVDIMYKEEPLCATYTLMDIMYIYHWRRKVPLHLSYRIFESASKRIKLSEDNDEFKQSLSNSNMEIESKDSEQSIKREWKEVQLKISETGVMSVTDISSLDTKKSTKVNEINQQSGLDQATSNTYSVNKPVVKTEEKEPVKSCTAPSRGRKAQQDGSSKRNEKSQEEKVSSLSTNSAISQNNSKSEQMELKSIDQRDLSNELLKTGDKCEGKPSNDSSQPASGADKGQTQQLQDKIKTEATENSTDKRPESRQNLTNNNFIGGEVKAETNAKPNAKSSESKTTPSAGSKINALSAKLQFQPKVGQVNNTYSKKSTTSDKKRTTSPPIKVSETKSMKTSSKTESKSTSDSNEYSKVPASSTPSSTTNVSSAAYSQSSSVNVSSVYVTAPSSTIDSRVTSANSHQQKNKSSAQTLTTSSESGASIGFHVLTTMSSSQAASLNSWINMGQKNSPNKPVSVDQQVRSLPGMPQIGKEIVCTTTASGNNSLTCGTGRYSIQTLSMSIFQTSPSKQQQPQTSSSKSGYEMTSMYSVPPPCPDAIPISLMKSANSRKDAVSKGTTLNEICDKIRSGSTKLGDSSKDKSKVDPQQRGKPEIPELLKISKKSPVTGESSGPSTKHIPNIPNVPMYTPSNSQQQQMQVGAEAKADSAKRPVAAIAPSQTPIMAHQLQKMPEQNKQSSSAAYKTLRYPPKNWNPTLSKNNYVAAKNQAKEMQAAAAAAAYGAADGSGASKQIASKPPKIFKNRNMPRYLGNPSSGVKPMYSVGNEQQLKEKESSSSSPKNSPTMTKIDPQTLSPIVSSQHNSTMVSPPPYSPTAARSSYQNSPYSRDLCRNSSNSSISPRNSPVNMLSTNPFIPSPTPNTNPRIIYFPPGYSDASHLSNPLIRPPIPPPSAYHCSLPPSINKLYQRSGYLPQTSVATAVAAAAAAAGFSPGVAVTGQMPTVQRMAPSSHSSSLPATSSPSTSSASSKSPKTSTASLGVVSSTSLNLARSEALTTTSSASTSLVDSVALQLAKGLAQRDLNVFDLTRAESLKSPSSDAKQMSSALSSSSSQSTQAAGKSNESQQKASIDASAKQSDTTGGKYAESATKSTAANNATATKDGDKKDKNLTKINGGITVTMSSCEKPKNAPTSETQQQSKAEKVAEVKNTTDGSSDKSSPSKSASCKNAQEAGDQGDSKQSNTSTQQKQESSDASDDRKTTVVGSTQQGNRATEAQKKMES